MEPVDVYPLFVYGTLLRGQRNHYLLDGRTRRVIRGWADGAELYALGSFPMMVEGAGRVVGEVVHLNPSEGVYSATLALLDRLEGVNGKQGPYRRVSRTVYTASGEPTLAWVYLGRRALVRNRPRVSSGDWVAFLAGCESRVRVRRGD